MKHSATSKSESEIAFNKASRKNALPVLLLFLLTLVLMPNTSVEDTLSASNIIYAVVSSAAVGALIATFISGYKRSDELEKQVQLKAAAITFTLTIFGLAVLSTLVTLRIIKDVHVLNYVYEVAAGLWFFIVLPRVAKRTYEK